MDKGNETIKKFKFHYPSEVFNKYIRANHIKIICKLKLKTVKKF